MSFSNMKARLGFAENPLVKIEWHLGPRISRPGLVRSRFVYVFLCNPLFLKIMRTQHIHYVLGYGGTQEDTWEVFGGPCVVLGVGGRLWEVCGTLWLSLEVFGRSPGVPEVNMGPAVQKFQLSCRSSAESQQSLWT